MQEYAQRLYRAVVKCAALEPSFPLLRSAYRDLVESYATIIEERGLPRNQLGEQVLQEVYSRLALLPGQTEPDLDLDIEAMSDAEFIAAFDELLRHSSVGPKYRQAMVSLPDLLRQALASLPT
ncbi:MAG TPA: hypothetical protein VD907_02500 [Verrucomicrobiae bacterium]|nr:hypothetical protein [Verrucomicrobiae bacterium]